MDEFLLAYSPYTYLEAMDDIGGMAENVRIKIFKGWTRSIFFMGTVIPD
jgi:hypothetical protein